MSIPPIEAAPSDDPGDPDGELGHKEDRGSRSLLRRWRRGLTLWWQRWRARAVAAGVGLLIGVAVTVLAVQWTIPNLDVVPALLRDFGGATGRFVRAFVLSPGFGALAALVAAAVAFESSRQVVTEQRRQTAILIAEQRRQAGLDRRNVLIDRREDRWYRVYELAYENASDTPPEASALTLEALDELSDTVEQETYVIALAQHLNERSV